MVKNRLAIGYFSKIQLYKNLEAAALAATMCALDDIISTASSRISAKRAKIKLLRNLNVCDLLHWIVAIVAFAMFIVLARASIAHFDEHVYFRTSSISTAEYLPWPVVTLKMDITRNASSSKSLLVPENVALLGFLDGDPLPEWANYCKSCSFCAKLLRDSVQNISTSIVLSWPKQAKNASVQCSHIAVAFIGLPSSSKDII